jgi:eukaryotic-like serine/threonine-protein kinase
VPTQLSPSDGAVFADFPRSTTLQWSAVPGVIFYGIEIDCGVPGPSGTAVSWGSETRPPQTTTSGADKPCFPLTLVTEPTYTFNFVGAQPGRWRVWAIGKFGQRSAKIAWRQFRYTR